jgi:hypothetical protein
MTSPGQRRIGYSGNRVRWLASAGICLFLVRHEDEQLQHHVDGVDAAGESLDVIPGELEAANQFASLLD